MAEGIFQSAIRGEDGEVDPGYFAMYVITMIVLGAIPAMVLVSIASAIFSQDHHFDAQALGIGIGSVCTGYGVALGAVGMYRMGDKK